MTPQVLAIQNGFNFRDLGGYQTPYGAVKFHKLIRSGRLDALSQADLKLLQNYGLKTVLDLRSPEELKDAPDKLPEGAKVQFLPVLPTDQTEVSKHLADLNDYEKDPFAGFKHMVQLYQQFPLMPAANHAYQKFFEALLANDQPDSVLLFHCSAGKDRTGMAAVYLLSALGVDPESIRDDYLFSNLLIGSERRRASAEIQKAGGSAIQLANNHSLFSVANEYLDAALRSLTQTYGSMQGYLKSGLHLTAGMIKDLRTIYLEK